jgi:hypothetical protein
VADPAAYEAPYAYPYAYGTPVATDRFGAFLARVGQRMPPWVAPAAAAVGVAGAVAYTLLVHPTQHTATSHPTCLLRLLTGFDCPGCGGTRAAWYLLHGDLPAAARHHAPFVFSLPFLIYMYVVWSLRSALGVRIPQLHISNRTIVIFLAAWAVFSVLRNLPFAPFSWLFV